METPVLNVGIRQSGRYNFEKIYHSSANEKKLVNLIKKIMKKKINLKKKSKIKNTSSLITNNIEKYLIFKRNNIFYKKFKDLVN